MKGGPEAADKVVDRFKFLYYCNFCIKKLWGLDPFASLALLFSAVFALCGMTTLWYWQMQSDAASNSLYLARMSPAHSAAPAALPISAAVELPRFSSAEFTKQFLSIARDTHVPTDELSYVLETGTAQPYWRYRVTLDLKTGYPELRRFIAMLSSELPNVSLDTIRCRREDTALSNLTCQLVFSAFFQKESGG